uniref:Ground-like domain-containing protein n=1 Tax=Parastrongyloides trichosuri TaxID=131310 RepID=A0A0N4ZYA8_PARTI
MTPGCSCYQSKCPPPNPCPQVTIPPINQSPVPVQTYYIPPSYTQTASYDASYYTASPTDTSIFITPPTPTINEYGYKETSQTEQIFVQPNEVKNNDLYIPEEVFNVQDMTANIEKNNLQPYRDTINKTNSTTKRTHSDKLDENKKKAHNKMYNSICNDVKLAKIMAEAIVSDISVSKLLISDAVSIAYNGEKINVICASGDFSYSILIQKEYCEATKGKVTCFAYF